MELILTTLLSRVMIENPFRFNDTIYEFIYFTLVRYVSSTVEYINITMTIIFVTVGMHWQHDRMKFSRLGLIFLTWLTNIISRKCFQA